jgi:hypothetical protein
MRVCWVLLLAACGFRHGTLGADGATDVDAPGDAARDGAPDAPPDAAQVPITVVQANLTMQQSGDAIACAFLAPQAAGHFELVVVAWGTTATLTSLSDSRGNTYVHYGADVETFETADIYYVPSTLADPAGTPNRVSAIFSASSNAPMDLRIVEYAGLATTNPIDMTMFAGATAGTALDTGSATTSNAHDLLVGIATVGAGTTATGTGYTKDTAAWGDLIEHREVTSSGSYNATAMQASSDYWMIRLLAIKAAR